MRLLTYNIRYGGLGREAPLGEVINASDPEIVLLQEATDPAVVSALAAALDFREWGSQAGESTAFLSRRPIARFAWHRLPGVRRAFLEIVPEDDRTFRLIDVHLSAIHSNWTEGRRVRELRGLLTLAAALREVPHIVAGDFNTLAPGERLETSRLPWRLRALVWLGGGRIRWRTIQVMLDADYVDAFRRLHPVDAGSTFPVWDPHIRLDYAFVPEWCADRVRACRVITEPDAVRAASDHCPLLIDLA